MTKDEWIERAKNIHNDKFDYSKVNYINSRTKVLIGCNIHGEFSQLANSHLQGNGCPICAKSAKTIDKDTFVKQAKEKHGNKYEYSKVNYKKITDKVCIICPEHGEFWQQAKSHLYGVGCPICSGNYKKDTNMFIKQSKVIHGNKYNYSLCEYINDNTKVKIICNKHGIFEQRPNHHLRGIGCPLCGREIIGIKNSLDTEKFIEKANRVHNNKYRYDKSYYKSSFDLVTITCPNHGDFQQVASYHLYGNGCPKCNMSSLERKVMNYLIENKIKFEHKKHFDWLKNKTYMELDFFLNDYNIAIECQGIQHFEERTFGSKNSDSYKRFIEQQERDALKYNQCKMNQIPLYYINYDCADVPNKIKSFLEKYC